jgi:hypothetical protein
MINVENVNTTLFNENKLVHLRNFNIEACF